MKTLKKHVESDHGGCTKSCAKAHGVSQQAIYKWLKEDVIVVNKKIYRHMTGRG